MCGRYASTLPPEMMAELFNLLNQIDYPPRYNIAPTQPIPVVWEQMGRRTIQLVRWGFIPNWVKDPREFSLLINARSETLREKPSFRDAARSARCVVPASGYYEWMKGKDGSRRPYYITMADDSPMAFAGLYSQWAGPNGEEMDTACIVTVEPNLEISSIYDRMPAILSTRQQVDHWLNTAAVEPRDAVQLTMPLPPGALKYHPIGKAIGRTDSEGEDLIRPLTPEELAAEPEPKPKKKKAAGGGEQFNLF
jgi:putative SOS response-associated peptidase YedK